MANGFFGTKESFFTPPQSPIRRTICQKSPIFAAGRIRVREQTDSAAPKAHYPVFGAAESLRASGPLFLFVLHVAAGAVARAEARRVGAVGLLHRFARLLHGAFDAAALHLLVGRDFRIDMMAFEHERERHTRDEERDGRDGAQNDDDPVGHNEFNLKSFPTPT